MTTEQIIAIIQNLEGRYRENCYSTYHGGDVAEILRDVINIIAAGSYDERDESA